MTEEGGFAAGKYGGHPVAPAADLAHGVHASMDPAQATVGDTALDGSWVDTECGQLPPGNDAVLPGDESGDDRVQDAHQAPASGRPRRGIRGLHPI
jgi:hypothetical protein